MLPRPSEKARWGKDEGCGGGGSPHAQAEGFPFLQNKLRGLTLAVLRLARDGQAHFHAHVRTPAARASLLPGGAAPRLPLSGGRPWNKDGGRVLALPPSFALSPILRPAAARGRRSRPGRLHRNGFSGAL